MSPPPEPADLARRVWAGGLLRVPGALQCAGNAAIARRLGRSGPARPLATAAGEALVRAGDGTDPDRPRVALARSQGEIVVERFLERAWAAQSRRAELFRITPEMLEGLNVIFMFGAPLGLSTTYPSASDLMDRLRPRVPAALGERVIKELDMLVELAQLRSQGPAASATSEGPAVRVFALTAAWIAAGVGLGALSGGVVGGGLDAAVGAVIGGGAGGLVALVRRRERGVLDRADGR